MTYTTHAELNSLISEIENEADNIRRIANPTSWFSADELERMRNHANEILRKIKRYEELAK